MIDPVKPQPNSPARAVAADRTSLLFFIILSWLGILCVFRSAVWNEGILLPLDVPAKLYSKYQWMNDSAGTIPSNHYLVDMFDYEGPRQYIAHEAIQRGEFPWWDPYSHGGSPLAAEAHISLTDPVRQLLYRLLPFEAAFNWTLILHSFLSGLSAFYLLRSLGFSSIATIFGALSYQFATCNAFFIFPPSVQGSFLYYPLLWMVWASWMKRPDIKKVLLGAAVVAAIFYSGNQQSDAYLPLFMLALCAGYSGLSKSLWRRSLLIAALSGLVGALLALPALIPQAELYRLCTREVWQGIKLTKCFGGILSLAGIYPWASGTFRTLDVGKVIGEAGLGFSVYIGTAGVLLAIWMLGQNRGRNARPELRVAALLLIIYFVLICSTPLLNILYSRSCGLAVLGLVVLAAAGIDRLAAGAALESFTRFCRWGVGAVVALAILLNLFAFAIYPKLLPRVKAYVLKREQANQNFDSAPALRTFQVENFPNEITIKNPEAFLALAAALSLLLVRKNGANQIAWALILFLNLSPMILYSRRLIPCESVASWRRLLQGGPAQQKIAALTQGWMRVRSTSPGLFDDVFPGVSALYYHVHLIQGYTSFELKGMGQKPELLKENVSVISQNRGLASAEVTVVTTNNVRFVWAHPNQRRIAIIRESLNRITLSIEAGEPGSLIRTDTWYPGWHVETPKALPEQRNVDGYLMVEVPSERIEVTFRYIPSHLAAAKTVSCVTAILCSLLMAVNIRYSKQSEAAAR